MPTPVRSHSGIRRGNAAVFVRPCIDVSSYRRCQQVGAGGLHPSISATGARLSHQYQYVPPLALSATATTDVTDILLISRASPPIGASSDSLQSWYNAWLGAWARRT